MALLLPLTAKQTRSMIAMQRIQPEIKKLQAQYKDDKQKQNEELMKFYQENNVNPLSGCLPLIVQMPVLFALFRVLRDIQDHVPTTGAFNDLFRDLCGNATTAAACTIRKGMYFLGMNLMVSPANSGSVTSNFIERLPYFIAVAAVVASGWYQMWQTQLRQKKLGSNQNNPMNKQMQMISRVFPIVFGWFSWIASSGLVLYFVTSSLWRIGQQHLVLNKYYEEQARRLTRQEESKPCRPARPRARRPTAATGQGRHRTKRRGYGERRRRARAAIPAHVPQEAEAQALNSWSGSRSRRRASTRPSSSRSTGSASSPTSWSTKSSTSPAAGCSACGRVNARIRARVKPLSREKPIGQAPAPAGQRVPLGRVRCGRGGSGRLGPQPGERTARKVGGGRRRQCARERDRRWRVSDRQAPAGAGSSRGRGGSAAPVRSGPGWRPADRTRRTGRRVPGARRRQTT